MIEFKIYNTKELFLQLQIQLLQNIVLNDKKTLNYVDNISQLVRNSDQFRKFS